MNTQNNAGQNMEAPKDTRHIKLADCAQREFPLAQELRTDGFQVVLCRSVWNDIRLHGQSSREVEVCGVLVGELCRDARGPFLYVRANIRGEHAERQLGQVTFTTETWTHIGEQMDRRYPEMRIVGWYHTHPGFGIFLSGMDLFIHHNFFQAPWQTAFVYDPWAEQDGLFLWRENEHTLADYLLEENEPCVVTHRSDLPQKPVTAAASSFEQLEDKVNCLERRLGLHEKILMAGAALLTLCMLLLCMLYLTRPKDNPAATGNPPDRPPLKQEAIKPGPVPEPSGPAGRQGEFREREPRKNSDRN